MRIGLVASIWIRVPPIGFGFGAQESLAYYIAEGLTKKGHDVTLFASGDSKTTAKLESVTPKQVMDFDFEDPKIKDVFELMNLEEAYKNSSSFDIIHNHLLPYGLLFTDLINIPTVHTLHHAIYKTRADYFLYKRFKNQNFISISNAQRKIMPELNYIETVYNGIDPNFYTFKALPDSNYILFLGRMKKYKGIHSAIQIAKNIGSKLIIASPLPDQKQSDYNEIIQYWNEEIKPNLGSNIEHLDNLEGKKKINLIQNAKLLISPNEREEPFGMTLIEAMSCGTPVVSYNKGAASEIVANKQTGFIIDLNKNSGITKMQEAVENIYNMPKEEYMLFRKNSQEHIEKNFTVKRMVENYEKVYARILQ